MFRFINLVLLVVISMLLTACGGGGGSSATINGITYTMTEISLSPSSLDGTNASTTISVQLRQQTNGQISAYYDSNAVTFTSTCFTQGKATISTAQPAANGTYSATYTNLSCSGSDKITANATISSVALPAVSKALSITNTATSSSTIQLGYYDGSAFIPSVIYGGGSSTNIPANSSTTLRLNAWNISTPYTTDISNNLSFVSNCSLMGKAKIDIDPPTNLGDGVYKATYTDQGCTLTNAQNTITATATVNGQTTNSATTTLGTTAVANAKVQMGSCTDNANCAAGGFVATLKTGSASLSAGAQTTISGVLWDTTNNSYYTSLTQVTLSSVCTLAGKATISNTSATNGQFSTTYQDNGCATTDDISATATVNGTTLTSSTSLIVTADTAGSIQFVSATPTTIAVKGSGLTEQSTVKFKVFGSSTALPLNNQVVTFSLSTTAGGVSLLPLSATTNSIGEVTTIVSSGTVPTPVRVNASTTVSGNTISAQSSELTISTTLPDQPHFSMAATTPNPTGAFEIQGINTDIVVLLADQFSNPPPAGTVVNFRAESGQISPATCSTDANGSCTVTWTSQTGNTNSSMSYYDSTKDTDLNGVVGSDAECKAPPTNLSNRNNANKDCINKAGRVTILAYASGSEGFIDNNSNGLFSDGDIFASTPANYATPPVSLSDYFYFDRRDLESPYLDVNFNYIAETGPAISGIPTNEVLSDTAQIPSNDYTGKYNGVLCSRTDNICSTQKSIYIFRNMEIVMPTRSSNISFWNNAGNATIASITAVGSYYALIQDTNGNTMGDGTTVAIAASASSVNLTVTATPPTIDKQAGYGHAVGFSVSRADPLQAATGSVEVTVTSGGIITTRSIAVSI